MVRHAERRVGRHFVSGSASHVHHERQRLRSCGALSGVAVAVTHANPSTSPLRRLLTEQGATVVDAPLIAAAPPADLVGAREACSAFAEHDWIVFTSVTSTRTFIDLIDQQPNRGGARRCAALGRGAAAALAAAGWPCDLAAAEPRSEALVAQLLAAGAAGKRVFVPHGEPMLSDVVARLRAAGVSVTTAITYRMLPCTPDDATLARASAADVVTLTSPSAARQWGAVRSSGEALAACIGPTTAEAARRSGVNVDVVADPAGTAGLAAALVQRFGAARGLTRS